VVERYVNRLKQWRAIATRYETRAVNYRAMVIIASLMRWLPSRAVGQTLEHRPRQQRTVMGPQPDEVGMFYGSAR
jgi:hypothetical protein